MVASLLTKKPEFFVLNKVDQENEQSQGNIQGITSGLQWQTERYTT